jgi:Rps23 Pro-64 3,4-dihydroxylase Tpa1-like proline 4-hydroxylase
MEIKPLDVAKLRQEFNAAQPFRWVQIDPFLDEQFAQQLSDAYPSFDESRALGHEFSAVNERRKVQVTDSARFPAPVARLHELLSGSEFLTALEEITGIPKLLADDELVGGGMHLTGPGGRLDVHVDFNYIPEQQRHRRLNILVYLNPVWQSAWGGSIELWDRDVKRRHHAFLPTLNRCVIFETNDISYHGVQPVSCPPDVLRKSFAAYYYTREAPPEWRGEAWSTIFRARPDELVRGKVLMPLEAAQRRARARIDDLKRTAKRVLGRS